MATPPKLPARPFKWLLLAVRVGLGLWYAGDAVSAASNDPLLLGNP